MITKIPKWAWTVLVIIIIILIILGILKIQMKKYHTQSQSQSQSQTTQIYPNYEFTEGLNKIKVPLIPLGQKLSQEAGGWVITPDGSEWIINNKVAINMEFIDGRIIHCEPHRPIYLGMRPANGIFRIYGSEKDTVSVSIKRNVY